jgi:hypothetical protein
MTNEDIIQEAEDKASGLNSVVRIKFAGKKQTFGHYRFQPDCPITKAMAAYTNRDLVKMDFLTMIMALGGKVQYSGKRTAPLDDLGMLFIEKPEE